MATSWVPSAPTLRFSPAVADALIGSEMAIAVTGVGGWLGRATLEMLDQALGTVALGSRVTVFASARRTIALRSGSTVEASPLTELATDGRLAATPHLLAHYAFLTREHVHDDPPGAYLSQNRAISDLVATHVERAPVTAAFVPSSGAVYGPDGLVQDDVERNPYGALKLADEQRFLSLRASTGTRRVVVFRVFNLAGPFLNKPERYALGSILMDVARGGPVRLVSDHQVIRSYVHVRDVIDLAIASMLGIGPVPSGPIDTAGDREVEVEDLAELALKVLGHPRLPIIRPTMSAPPDRYVGDGSGFASLASSCGVALAPLEAQITDTARYLGAWGAA
ncbi:MAG: NAD-dependent epimerase/dehydratase family protein [Acidimicrobiales bacterium]